VSSLHLKAMKTPFRTTAVRSEDPGIGSSFERPLERLVAKDGQFKVFRLGGVSGFREGFVALATMPLGRLIGTFLLAYLFMNLVFASVYMLIGVEQLGNADLSSERTRWLSAIGMSVQTLTTVGYGSVYPTTFATWFVAAVEGVFGILGFSLISAVIYARFARPDTMLAYSEKALIAPFKEGWSLQMRLANKRSTLLMELEARAILVMADVDDQGEKLNYYNLKLQLERVNFMPLSWTVVHPISPDSPLAGVSYEDLVDRRAEVILILKAVDEGYMQNVYTRRSFRYDEIVWGARYNRPFSAKNGIMHLDLDKMSDHVPVEIPTRLPVQPKEAEPS
jgi:inward rectifier potassium channel